MKNKRSIQNSIANRRFRKELVRKRKRKISLKSKLYRKAFDKIYRHYTETELIDKFLSDELKYLMTLHNKTGILMPDFMNSKKYRQVRVISVPKVFSLVKNPDKSYKFIKDVVNTIFNSKSEILKIDYSRCKKIHLEAQVYLDVILKDLFSFLKKCRNHPFVNKSIKTVEPINFKQNSDIVKLLYSIGSFAIHLKRVIPFDDITPYPLCEFQKSKNAIGTYDIHRKGVDTTEMVDYVIDSLKKVRKKLTGLKIDDLSTVIGEVLINAEEHSTTGKRYSLGYFQEYKNGSINHHGSFNLVIFNFGDTIYQKFKNDDCLNKKVVKQMEDLSNQYTSSKLFIQKYFEEETLWTLYALQEGVTSTSPIKYIKRGNGSIRFIESFFNIKGDTMGDDTVSRLNILSGNTSITFDGTYGIQTKIKNNEVFRVMTFNDSGEISEVPNKKYVKFTNNYFPGTIISAKILINKDDVL